MCGNDDGPQSGEAHTSSRLRLLGFRGNSSFLRRHSRNAAHCDGGDRFERSHRDVRLDELDHYKAVFQLTGHSTIYQNDQCVRLAEGDVALVDAARPITCVSDDARVRLLSLHLPRRSLVSHLGFEPQGGDCRCSGESPAGRLLYEVVLDALKQVGSACPPTDSYMQLAVYNLLGALFAPPDPPPSSPHAHKLFMRIRDLINDRTTSTMR